MKDKNVYRANISWKPLFIGLIYFWNFWKFPRQKWIFRFFSQKNALFRCGGKLQKRVQKFSVWFIMCWVCLLQCKKSDVAKWFCSHSACPRVCSKGRFSIKTSKFLFWRQFLWCFGVYTAKIVKNVDIW